MRISQYNVTMILHYQDVKYKLFYFRNNFFQKQFCKKILIIFNRKTFYKDK